MKRDAYSVAVVGATGVVGTEIIRALEERGFPLSDLQLYSSLRSAGEYMSCAKISALVEPLGDAARFEQSDIIFLAASEQVTAEWLERATASGAVAIDSSGLLADDPDIPLVVPEANASEIARYAERNVLASPDAPAVALAVVLVPLRASVSLRRIGVTTLEPVSGAGRAGIAELEQQTLDLMNGRHAEENVFPQRIAFNALPHVGEFLVGGMSRGEFQTASAVRRLLDAPELPVGVTRVRTSMFYGTALSVNIEMEGKLGAEAVREMLRGAPGVLLLDDLVDNVYPTPASAVAQDAVCVGRIREDEMQPILDLWITIDNTRKGSAVNAVQIAEILVRDHL